MQRDNRSPGLPGQHQCVQGEGGADALATDASVRRDAVSRFIVTVKVTGGAGGWCRHGTRLPVRQQSTKIRCPNREPRCAVLPCRDCVVHPQPEPPRRAIRVRRDQRRSRWRRLDPGRQALLALAHLRNGDTLSRLAAGFQIGVTTAWRYVREAIDLLAITADDLASAMTRIRLLAYAILDGTLIPIDRVADQKPCC